MQNNNGAKNSTQTQEHNDFVCGLYYIYMTYKIFIILMEEVLQRKKRKEYII